MESGDSSRVRVEIQPATLDQKPVLANLLELYAHDFSELVELDIGRDGRFGYPDLDFYWTAPGRFPFLLHADGQLAGFVLIKASSQDGLAGKEWDVAEFFILRGHRGRGLGTEAAHQVWRRFPGRWAVRVMAINEPANRFWRQAIEKFAAGGHISETGFQQGGKEWRRLSFVSSQ